MIALMRLILAASALIIIYIDPSEPDRYISVTYLVRVAYTVYSAALYLIAMMRKATTLHRVIEWSHWADVGWYVLLITLSSGTNSIFFSSSFRFWLPLSGGDFEPGCASS